MDPRRCVFIDEIFQKLVRNLEDAGSRLGIALCCRAFLETALDALWAHSLEGLNPLVLCLPEGLIDRRDRERYPWNFAVSRNPFADLHHPIDWTAYHATTASPRMGALRLLCSSRQENRDQGVRFEQRIPAV